MIALLLSIAHLDAYAPKARHTPTGEALQQTIDANLRGAYHNLSLKIALAKHYEVQKNVLPKHVHGLEHAMKAYKPLFEKRFGEKKHSKILKEAQAVLTRLQGLKNKPT
jgi:hypothetical protein